MLPSEGRRRALRGIGNTTPSPKSRTAASPVSRKPTGTKFILLALRRQWIARAIHSANDLRLDPAGDLLVKTAPTNDIARGLMRAWYTYHVTMLVCNNTVRKHAN
jgi:hypothetical protein